ncbi:MAG: hypothetical protein AB8B80_04585 [Marinicellaceae bacterium]
MKVVIYLSIVILLSACDPMKLSANSYENSQKTTWIYVEIQSNGKSSDYRYFLFGEMKESLYHDISNNVIESGFFMLASVKYYDNNNVVANYSDGLYTGNMVFRIEDIQLIKKMKKPPVIGIGANEATEELGIEKLPE